MGHVLRTHPLAAWHRGRENVLEGRVTCVLDTVLALYVDSIEAGIVTSFYRRRGSGRSRTHPGKRVLPESIAVSRD